MKTNLFWAVVWTAFLIAIITAPNDYDLNFSFLTNNYNRIFKGATKTTKMLNSTWKNTNDYIDRQLEKDRVRQRRN